MYFVIITRGRGGKKGTKSTRNANDFKPNQPLITQKGFISNAFERRMNLQLGEVAIRGAYYSQALAGMCSQICA